MKKVYKPGWKVVKVWYQNTWQVYTSVCAINEIVYHLGKKTVPLFGLGPLCVFTNKKDAKAFQKKHCYLASKLFPCTYLPEKKVRSVWEYFMTINGKRKPSKRALLSTLPKGTALAKEVILLEERKEG